MYMHVKVLHNVIYMCKQNLCIILSYLNIYFLMSRKKITAPLLVSYDNILGVIIVEVDAYTYIKYF